MDALLEDARHARAAGDLDRAIRLLEEALSAEPSHPVVRFELASTLMRAEGIDLLTLEQTVSHLLEPGNASALRPSIDGACTFGLLDSAQPFDPRAFPEAEQIFAARPTVERVVQLLSAPASANVSPAMPPQVTELDICEVISPEGLQYNRTPALNALSDRFETHSQVTGALTANAVALTLASYINLFEQPDLDVEWYIVNGQDLGACVAEDDIDVLIERASAEVHRAGQALISIDLLVHHSGNTHFETVLGDGVDFYHTLQSDEINPCND